MKRVYILLSLLIMLAGCAEKPDDPVEVILIEPDVVAETEEVTSVKPRFAKEKINIDLLVVSNQHIIRIKEHDFTFDNGMRKIEILGTYFGHKALPIVRVSTDFKTAEFLQVIQTIARHGFNEIDIIPLTSEKKEANPEFDPSVTINFPRDVEWKKTK